MKTLVLILISISLSLFGQETKNVKFQSDILNETRPINIHIPAAYKTNDKNYPVIYALDGEYAQLAINGTIDYYSYWEDIPECIVVSIDQNYADSTENSFKRWSDCSYNGKTGFINKKGEKFKNFITAELIPYIDKEYRTTSFKTLVGHSFTANFVNYFLFDENPVFSGYVSISPYYAKNSLDSLEEVFKNLTAPVFYYVASGDNDLSGHIKSVNEFDQRMQKIDNAHFIYRKFDVENNQATHSSILPIAIPYAIEHIFSLFSPLNEQDYEQVLKTENKLNFLTQRYRNVENLYGITLPIRESDINIVAYAIMESKQWEQLKEISEIAITLYPENVYGYYLLGDYHEEKKEYSLALEQYEIGFSKLGEDVLNKEDFQEPINKLKKKIKSLDK